MGPTNLALVTLYRADQDLRAARERLDAATKNVRVQERRVHDLEDRLRQARQAMLQAQSQAGQLDLDLKSREAHLEKLRTQQQNAKNNKEYQAFLVEINTEKLDRNKIEERTMQILEQVERDQGANKELATHLETERTKLGEMRSQIGDRVAALQAEIDALQPAREEAAAAASAKALTAFERLAQRMDGDAMAAISRPNRKREEYICTACNMELVVDTYNRLHTRDELVFCTSCQRILYIPEDLTPEAAINKPKEKRETKSRTRAGGAAMPRQSSASAVHKSITVEDDAEEDSEGE